MRRETEAVTDAVLSIVLDHTTDGVLLVDQRGMIAYANRPLHRLFGYSDGDVVGQPLDLLVPEDFRERHQANVRRFQKGSGRRPMGRADLDIEGRHADGTSIAVDIQLDRLPGQPYVVATVRDMALQRQSSVDRAIDKLDLGTATNEADRLRRALDLVIQDLFALGTWIEAGAIGRADRSVSLASVCERIDEMIHAVQLRRQPDPSAQRQGQRRTTVLDRTPTRMDRSEGTSGP